MIEKTKVSEQTKGWPAGVEPLVLEEFERLGRNAANELFWDGKHLITRRQYLLTGPQAALALLAAIASIATIATGLNNASVFLCARGITWLSCPVAAAPPAATSPVRPQPGAPTTR